MAGGIKDFLKKKTTLCAQESLPWQHQLKKTMERVANVITDFMGQSVYCFCTMFRELGLCVACDFSSLVDDFEEFDFVSLNQVTKPGHNVKA